MATTIEAFEAATAELRLTRIANQALADLVGERLSQKATEAATVINNFVNRAPSATFFVDANLGTDAPGFGSLEKPFKSLDYCLDVRDQSVVAFIYLLTDDTLKKTHGAYASVTIAGASRAAGGLGLPFSYARRKLGWFNESSDSPIAGTGRTVPSITTFTGSLLFFGVNIAMPAPLAEINQVAMLQAAGGSFAFNGCNVTCDNIYSIARLIASVGGQRFTTTATNFAIDAQAKGKIFAGIGADQDPRTNFVYETNITAA